MFTLLNNKMFSFKLTSESHSIIYDSFSPSDISTDDGDLEDVFIRLTKN